MQRARGAAPCRLVARSRRRDQVGARRDAAEARGAWPRLEGVDGILVPGGFGERGIEGKVAAAQVRPREPHPLFRAVPGHAGHVHRVRPQRAPPARRQLDRVQPEDARPDHLAHGRPAGHRGHGRHDAAGPVAVPAPAGQPRGRCVRARGPGARAASPPLGVQQPVSHARDGQGPELHRRSRPTAGWSRLPSWTARCTRGCWACSSTRSSCPGRTGRIRYSRPFLKAVSTRKRRDHKDTKTQAHRFDRRAHSCLCVDMPNTTNGGIILCLDTANGLRSSARRAPPTPSAGRCSPSSRAKSNWRPARALIPTSTSACA